MRPVPRTCLSCGRVTWHGSRCAKCHSKPTAEARKTDRRYRTEAVANWLAMLGPWCPGYRRDGHWVASEDLTADHDRPGIAVTDWQDLAVLCRSCNSRKKDAVD